MTAPYLIIDVNNLTNLGPVGTLNLKSTDKKIVTVQGDITAVLDPNYLYSFTNPTTGANYWGRFNWSSYDTATATSTLHFTEWHDNIFPLGPTYSTWNVWKWANEAPVVYGKTMCMIGDSVTGQGYAMYLRGYLRQKGLQYDFVGPYIDILGYRHAAVGGNTTQMMIDRITNIPFADSYYIMAGTNDYSVSTTNAHISLANVALLALLLKEKNPNACINIATLPQRNDAANSRNIAVSALYRGAKWPVTVNISEVMLYLPPLGSWISYLDDSVHPNLAGYDLMTDVLISRLL